jgi:putative hydrolase of HD superfamily
MHLLVEEAHGLRETPQIASGNILTVDTDGLIDFIAEAGRLKRLPRTGWVESGVPDPESVADHSFRVALIALVLADAKGLDSLKAVRMALLHDLAEAETGDLTPVQKGTDPEASKRVEDEAMGRLLDKLPEAIRGAYRDAWREFSEASTEEARLVRDADKLEMVIQASEYQKGAMGGEKLMRFWHAKINGEEAKAIRDAVKNRARKRV